MKKFILFFISTFLYITTYPCPTCIGTNNRNFKAFFEKNFYEPTKGKRLVSTKKKSSRRSFNDENETTINWLSLAQEKNND